MVNAKTRLLGLLGYPLNFTFSPRMHNETFQRLGLDCFYFPIEVGNDHLGDVLNGIRYMNFAGGNVTKPNKVKVLEYLDELDPLAEKIGSANTYVLEGGKLRGYNTDGEGFVRALLETKAMDLTRTDFFVIGAGGASRALCFTLAVRGARKLLITDAFDEVARVLVDELNAKVGPCAEFVASVDGRGRRDGIARSSVLVNASGIGMEPHLGESPIPKSWLHEGLFVCDIVYNPLKTKLLEDAESIGLGVMNGIGMVVNQGALSFSLWTGVPEPRQIMREVMDNIVAGV